MSASFITGARRPLRFSAPANDASGSYGGAAAARLPHGVSMLSPVLRQGLPELPVRMRGRPDGTRRRLPDLGMNLVCARQNRCRLCGGRLGRYKAFVLQPIGAVNRVSPTAPAHIECAKYVAQIECSPGVSLVWTTRDASMICSRDKLHFQLGEPEQTFWYAESRCASRDEVRASLEEALPELYRLAHAEGEAAVLKLDTMVARAVRYLPPHAAGANVARPA